MKASSEWQKQWQESIFNLENRLKGQLETLKDDRTEIEDEVEKLKSRVNHFLQSLTKVLRVPSLLIKLENRLEALENV